MVGATGEYSVRQARQGELEWLQQVEDRAAVLFRDVGMGEIGGMAGLDLATLANARERELLWVLARPADDRAVGFALVLLLAPDCGADRAAPGLSREPAQPHLRELNILPEHGGRGLGTRLLRAVVRDLQRRGYQQLTLSTFRDVPWNAPWYRRLGFRELSEEEQGGPLSLQAAREGLGSNAARVVMGLDLAEPGRGDVEAQE